MLRRLSSGLARLSRAALLLSLSACPAKSERLADGELSQGLVVRSAPRKLVVLGSSTAAGVGPRDAGDAYLPRYQTLLSRQFPDFTLVNLAASGQTTYHIQPSGFTPPAGRPAPSVGKNISAALALGPAAILVNLPSNDAAAQIPVTEQLDNFARVAKLAEDAKVLLWVSSTQPRNFAAEQIAVQQQLRKVILDRYSPRALDFWTPFAAADGSLKREYDAGDGIHLNAAGHTILLGIVVRARLPQAVLELTH